MCVSFTDKACFIYIFSAEDVGEPEAKRRKDDVAEGERLIEETLTRVHQLLKETSGEQFQQELEKIKEDIVATNNSYVMAILSGKTM